MPKRPVEALKKLQSYVFNLKDQLANREKLGGKLSDEKTAKTKEVINDGKLSDKGDCQD